MDAATLFAIDEGGNSMTIELDTCPTRKYRVQHPHAVRRAQYLMLQDAE